VEILFLSTWFPYPPDNGSKLRVYHLLRALAENNNIMLLSFAFGTASPESENELGNLCQKFEVVHINPHRRSLLANSLRFFSPVPLVTIPIMEMKSRVKRAMLENSFDVVIASTKGMASYALMLQNETAIILEEHNATSRQMWERYQGQMNVQQRMRYWVSWQKQRAYESRILRRFDLVTMVSKQDQLATLQVLRNHETKVEVVPNGVDCRHNRPGLSRPRSKHLVFNGSLTFGANYDAMQYFLRKIYPLIRQDMPGVSLTITGATNGVDLDGLELDESVQFSGFVDDIRYEMSKATVCVVPVRQGGGTRLKILEAMALGIAVVATTKGAEGFTAVDGEHLLLADDPKTFTNRTMELLCNDFLRQRVTANARRLVEERYDWAQIGKRFVDLVEATIGELKEDGR
jgi:glycosyltransferase involved in cell wall biosynthesis